MDWLDLALYGATVIASFCQAVTGIGFGMIAGPVVLIVINDPSAVIISTLMSWLIALVLFPALWRGTDLTMLLRFLIGAACLMPVGLALLSVVSVDQLKLLAGFAIGALTLMMVFGAPGMATRGRLGDMIFGGLAGLLGACLAMPGPTAAIRMSALGFDKKTVRATMVSFFSLVWPMVFLGQAATRGLGAETLWTALALVPATLTGVLVGHYAASRVSEAVFRRMVIVFLLATSISLLAASGHTYLGDRT